VHRQTARRPRLVAGALIAALAGCRDDEPSAAAPQVVVVAGQPCRRPTRDLGLGVVIDDGTVLTAAHTVDGARRSVTVDGRAAAVVAVDPRADLALLTADVAGPAVVLDDAAAGAAHVATASGIIDVDVVGTGPLVVHDTTAGLRHEREVHTLRPEVPAGTSGAPLLGDDGRLLGIVVLDNRTDGTAYAVTAAEIDRFLGERPTATLESGCGD
jgi:hypothetical protein